MTTNPNTLTIEIAASVDEAPNWSRDHCDVRAVDIRKAIIVCHGMKSGAPTVDFVIAAEGGEQFVAMLTGTIVKQLAVAVTGAEQRTRP